MNLARQLSKHLEHTMSGPMWHGPALAEVLDGVTAERAAARPIADAHTIWEIVLHVIAWAEIARARLKGQSTGDPTPAQDWPPVDAAGSDAWQRAIKQLDASHRLLAADARELDDARLDALVPGLDYSVAVLLHGIVEHGTYHGGQIALLKRALAGADLGPTQGGATSAPTA
jgi:uncharacterized damage-inducible protein DinB